jgi:hypothetical protein
VWNGRKVVVTADELTQALSSRAAIRDAILIEALARSGRPAAAARLEATVSDGSAGPATMAAVYGLVKMEAKSAAPALLGLAERLSGPPAAIARAAAYLVADRVADLSRALAGDADLARHSPQPFAQLRRVPAGSSELFAGWLQALKQSASQMGVSAHRTFIGDVAEAAFRALQNGASADALLGTERAYLVDLICAELPGTTDFLAARGMVWLVGALAAEDDAARTAIERARGRFHDEPFAADCHAILAGDLWPPPPR